MKKRILVIFTLLLYFSSGFAQSNKITVDEGKQLALEFSNKRLNRTSLSESSNINISVIKDHGFDLMYVYSWEDAFVILSANKNFPPIIAYSASNPFPINNVPPIITSWMEGYKFGMTEELKSEKPFEAHPRWELLEQELSSNNNTNKGIIVGVSPLLTSRWNQDKWYNDSCPPHPLGPNGRCYAGCVATAMGQVMYYFKYPEQGNGHSYYSHPHFGLLSANYGNTTYNWSAMGNIANINTRAEISKLLYHCGVAVEMNYSPSGSGSQTELIVNALRNHFRYAPEITMLDRGAYSVAHWRRIIIDNLYQRKPVIYAGSGAAGGHAWVCDGVDDSLYFHMNWGWGGSGDGYFLLDSLNSGNGDFSLHQRIVVNIAPLGYNFCFQPKEYFETEMTFNDGSANNLYKNNTDCYYYIRSDSLHIRLNFIYFNTEAENDVLTIFDGDSETAPILAQLSGNQLPPVIFSSSSNLLLRFTTNETVQRQGWEVRYLGVRTTDIDEIDNNTIQFYPNPASDFINVRSNTNATFKIVSISGQVVSSGEIATGGYANIPVNHLSNGIYILKLTDNKNVSVAKFLKQ